MLSTITIVPSAITLFLVMFPSSSYTKSDIDFFIDGNNSSFILTSYSVMLEHTPLDHVVV